MNTIGARLKYARDQLGWTQDRLATAIGTSRGVVTNIEAEKTEPQPIVVKAICSAMGLNPEWLMYGQNQMIATPTSEETLNELREIASRLPEAMQLVLLDTAQSMVKRLEIERSTPNQAHHPRSVDDLVAEAKTEQENKPPGRGPTSPGIGR